jgi:hypothetical protein
MHTRCGSTAYYLALYPPEVNDVYIHIRPTSLPEATTFSCLYTAEPSATFRIAELVRAGE